jgi:hypothetical protein
LLIQDRMDVDRTPANKRSTTNPSKKKETNSSRKKQPAKSDDEETVYKEASESSDADEFGEQDDDDDHDQVDCNRFHLLTSYIDLFQDENTSTSNESLAQREESTENER